MSTGDHTAQVEYRQIPGRDGFRFGSDGSVQSAWRKSGGWAIGSSWRTLNANPRTTGYSWVYLGRGPDSEVVRLDGLICEAFHGSRPAGMECLHRDGDRGNCRASNLFWGIAPENVRDPSVEYRTIPESEGYEFGSDGSVWSYWWPGALSPGDVPRRMTPARLSSGHLQVSVRWEGRLRKFGVHRLICWAFHGPCPEDMECCHDDGIPDHNEASNLYWGTPQQNVQDQIRHGVLKRGESHHQATLTEVDVVDARMRYAAGESSVSLGRHYGVTSKAILQAVSGETWSHVPGAVKARSSAHRTLSDEEVSLCRQRYARGQTSVALAREYGVSNMTVLRAIRGDSYRHLPGAVEIRPNSPRKLSDSQEDEVVRLAIEERWTLARIAKEFDIHPQTVANILARR